jgi:hypothetical protein
MSGVAHPQPVAFLSDVLRHVPDGVDGCGEQVGLAGVGVRGERGDDDRRAMTSSRLDRELVEALIADRIEPEDENTLADQVSRLLPFHAILPNPQAGDLS